MKNQRTEVAEAADEGALRAAVEGVLEELVRSADNEMPAMEFRRALQILTEGGAGIVRTEAGLREALSQLEKCKTQGFAMGEKAPAYFFENKSLLLTAEAVLRAALLRDESRGPHLRFAGYDDNTPIPRQEGTWEKYIVIRRGDGTMELDIRNPAE